MKKKIKVAEFISFTGDGGVEALVKDYALMLDPNKFEVIIITLQRVKNASVDRILTENNIKIYSLYEHMYSNKSIIAKALRKVNNIWYIPYIVQKVVKKEEIDVLHIHLGILNYLFLIRKILKRMKLFYTCHSDPKIFFRKKEICAAKYFANNCDLTIIALHNEMKIQISRMLNIKNVIVMNNGIDFDRFRQSTLTKEQCKKRIGIPDNKFVVGNIGRFVESKNHLFLIDVFKLIWEKRPNAFLLLVGSGALKKDIEDKLNSYGLKNYYLILENRTDMPEVIRSMDVFVFPTKYEGFPVSMIEVQVSGVRCVAADTVTSDAFLSDNTISMRLQDDPQKWCDVALDTMITEKHKGKLEDYSINNVIKRVECLYCNK